MATIKLPNGIVITASEAMINKVISGLEDGIHYNSKSRGERIRISDMATSHLRNALLKSLKESLEEARTLSTPSLVEFLGKGIGTDSVTTAAMFKELSRRRD